MGGSLHPLKPDERSTMDQLAFIPAAHGPVPQTSPVTSSSVLQGGVQNVSSGVGTSSMVLTSSITSGLALAAVASANRRRGAQHIASPLRAFENELGVQAPVGYWDPLGLGKDGDADVFRR